MAPSVKPEETFRVLVTGFGPFGHYKENPSWLAVKPLQNEILHTNITPDQIPLPEPPRNTGSTTITTATPKSPIIYTEEDLAPRPIHVSTLQVPMSYEEVEAVIPNLHARPPILPESAPKSTLPPPKAPFDFIMHISVAGRGPLRMERVGHKLGYQMKDVNGKYANIVRSNPKDFSRREGEIGGSRSHGAPLNEPASTPPEEVIPRNMSMNTGIPGMTELTSPAIAAEGNAESGARPTRGCGGPAYETMPEELQTDLDCTRLVQDLKRDGMEIYTSMDAGHYLCDFIYYCSLAEAKRSVKPYEKRRTTRVLALHCCPVGSPLSTEEVTQALRQIIIRVCNDQQLREPENDNEVQK